MSIFFVFGAACIMDIFYESFIKVKKETEIRIKCANERAAYNRKRYHSRKWN